MKKYKLPEWFKPSLIIVFICAFVITLLYYLFIIPEWNIGRQVCESQEVKMVDFDFENNDFLCSNGKLYNSGSCIKKNVPFFEEGTNEAIRMETVWRCW